MDSATGQHVQKADQHELVKSAAASNWTYLCQGVVPQDIQVRIALKMENVNEFFNSSQLIGLLRTS